MVGETKGLSEKEKKEIFLPGAKWGRKLRPGEQPFAELGQEHKAEQTKLGERNSGHTEEDSDNLS